MNLHVHTYKGSLPPFLKRMVKEIHPYSGPHKRVKGFPYCFTSLFPIFLDANDIVAAGTNIRHPVHRRGHADAPPTRIGQ
jgi:hypothetical protein